MAIVDWTFSPASSIDREFDRLRRQVEDVFGKFNVGFGARSGFPAMNIYDLDDSVVVAVEAPGLTTEGLSAEMRENVLTISGKREASDFGDAAVLRAERFDGEFRRTLRIPFKVMNEKIEASIKNGILMIRLTKAEEAKPKRIAIHA